MKITLPRGPIVTKDEVPEVLAFLIGAGIILFGFKYLVVIALILGVVLEQI
jgi:hypothetical protein